jgi:hypothetical protein
VDICSREGDDARSCDNGVDEDGDGYYDCDDTSCLWATSCGGDGETERTDGACSDGLDNDGNGYVDCDDFACLYTGSVTICR